MLAASNTRLLENPFISHSNCCWLRNHYDYAGSEKLTFSIFNGSIENFAIDVYKYFTFIPQNMIRINQYFLAILLSQHMLG